MTIKVANAPCSWGALEFAGMQGEGIGYQQMLDELRDSGYVGTELGDWGYMPTDAAQLRAELDSRRLAMVGAFVPIALKYTAAHQQGEEDALRVARLLRDVAATMPGDKPQAPFLVLADANGTEAVRTHYAGQITPQLGLSDAEWRTFAAGAERIARRVRLETGLVTVFHHHSAGYVETPSEIARLLDMTDPDLLGLVLDTGHYQYGSGTDDPQAVLDGFARFGERIHHVHYKDCNPLVATAARRGGWNYFKAIGSGVFGELGSGSVPFPLITDHLRGRGYDGWIVVEQDVLPGMGAPKASAMRNREYLRTLGLLSKGAVTMNKVNIGLIGAGRIGRVHAESIKQHIPLAHLSIVADVYGEAARQCATQFDIPQSSDDYRTVLADPMVEAVLICSSTDTHARIIAEAAAAGKHIFCEKPIAHDLAAIDKALAAVAQAGVKLQIGFNRRFDANYMRVRQAISSGEIGKLQLLHIISRDPAPPPIEYIRLSGGMFMDMTIHDFDMLRFLTGSEATEIYTMAAVQVDPAIGEAGDVDTAMMMLRCENEVIVTIDNCRRAVYGYDQRAEAFGSGGAISTANNYANAATISDAQAIRRDLPLNFFMERYTDSFRAEVQAFIQAVQQDQPTAVNGHDGRMPVVMALAAAQSHRERRPVRLSEITAEEG